MLKILMPGAMVAALACAAGAAPVPAVAALPQLAAPAPSADIVQVRDDHYRAGRHYRRAPEHWHRYHRRPADWYTRGCIIVGPFWFCP